MCGICGKLNLDFQKPVEPELLRRMMSLLHHRGPDGEGEYRSGPIGLGHRRLSIIDLDTGGQPMSNEDGTVWVVYNGEIYNFQELRSSLQSSGHVFLSSTDTEVIIHLYEESGEDCVAELEGMFAFALWDERKQFLLLARDRVGIKPLYYTNTGKSLLFSSEIKSLLADPSVARGMNSRSLDRFFTYGYLPGNETLLDGIFKLDPGHYLSVRPNRTEIRQYWDLRFEVSPRWNDYEEATVALRQLLRRSVKDHMISDVPVGVLLSGGVDSTGVLRYAVEDTREPIHTFTVGFSGAEFADERPYARMAARRFGTVHEDITMTERDFRDFLPKYVWHMEEPVFEPPAIALYYVARLAQTSGIKVLLSGEGGDEAFGGYQNYRNLLLLERLKSAFGPAKGLLGSGMGILEKAGWTRIGKFCPLVNLPLDEYYLSRTENPFTAFNKLRQSLYTDEFLRYRADPARSDNDYPTHSIFTKTKGQHLLNRMLYVDTKTWLPDDLLVKADKMTMATSVELRVPLLDFRVLEFAASLPPSFKVKGWKTKRILKAALEDSVPPEIINRKKTGFPVPYNKWLGSREIHDFVSDTVLLQNSRIRSFIRVDRVREILETHKQTGEGGKIIFCLLILGLWDRQFTPSGFIDGSSRSFG